MSNRKPRLSFLRRLGAGTAALAFAAVVSAQQRELDIPAGELATAIEAYIAATGQQVLYKVDDVKGKRSNGVRGALPPEEALRQLLAGTPLSVKRDASGAMVVFTEAAAASAATGEGGTAGQGSAQTVYITAKGFSHLAERNRTGTRTDTDPMDLPQSVSTVKRQLIEEQQASDLRQILANVAGVASTPRRNPSGFKARGLDASVTRNGSITDASSTRPNPPSFAIESVEVVRGAESVVGGQAAGYGGLINVVTKAANGQRVGEVQTRLGSRGLRALGLDLGDVVPGLPELSARVVAETERNGRTASGYEGAQSDYLSASTAWERKSSGTTLQAEIARHLSREPYPNVVYAPTLVDNSLVPPRFPVPDAGTQNRETSGSLTLSQTFGKGWLARLHVDRVQFQNVGVVASTFGSDLAQTFPLITATRSEQSPSRSTSDAQRVEVMGPLALGPLSNQLLLGFDNTRNRFGATSYTDVSSVSFDLSEGSWTDNSAANGLPAPPSTLPGATRTERGLILQDQWYLGEHWAGLLAARRINVDFFGLQYSKWLPSAGLVYRVTPTLSLYGNSTQSILSNAEKLTVGLDRLPDETARSREIGAKAILGGGAVALTGTYYQIRRYNAAVPDFDNDPTGQFYRTDPELFSRGIELEASGSTGPHWSWRLGATTNRLTNADGVRQTEYPSRQFNAYLRYSFSGEQLGWWSSLLLSHQTSAEAGRKARNQVDLGAGYNSKSWSLTASAKSVAARRLLETSGTDSAVVDQERGLDVMASFKF